MQLPSAQPADSLPAVRRQPGLNDTTDKTRTPATRLAAVGDLLLACDTAGTETTRDPAATVAAIREQFAGCGIVFGNLECTLAGDGRTVPTQPRVISTAEMVRGIAQAGFNVVTLANNHMFDCFRTGFARLRDLLDEMGIAHFGAGDDLAQATAPAVVEAGGLRVGLLGAVDRRSGPGQFAGPGQWGVAPLEMDRLSGQIRELAGDVDHVVVSIHWGEERFLVPSPQQIAQARAMVDAGATLVLGHHPHVIQGVENYRGATIVYSLGNFVACDVPYTDGNVLQWNRLERTGCILLADVTAEAVAGVRQVPTYDDGYQVRPDAGGRGARRIARANRALAHGVTPRRYRREHLWIKTVKPALRYLRWSKLKTLRLRQLTEGLAGLVRARRAE